MSRLLMTVKMVSYFNITHSRTYLTLRSIVSASVNVNALLHHGV